MNDIKQLIEEVGRNIQAVRAGDSQTANDRMGRAAVVAVLKEIRNVPQSTIDTWAGVLNASPTSQAVGRGQQFLDWYIDALLAQEKNDG
jgi:hypothetical protein